MLNNKVAIKKDVGLQLNFLENQLKHLGLGKEMQMQYPEGFVFIHVLYGLTYCELGKLENEKSEIYKKALAEAHFAYEQINTENSKKKFDEGLLPAFGIFYRGWQNYLLGKIISLQANGSIAETKTFKANCEEIAYAFGSNQSPYIESYRNAAWPADAFVAIASLQLHDQLFEIKYDSLIKNWISKVKANLDPFTDLVPHEFDHLSGKILEGARGSSTSLILLFLADLDHDFAKQQFANYKKHFLISRLGLPAIREYRVGKEGKGDIDSGPVVFDISFPGTILSVGSFYKMSEITTATCISHTIENFGLAMVTNQQKKFLFGAYPMADAFIAWTRIQCVRQKDDQNSLSRIFKRTIYIHLFSLLSIILILIFLKKTSKYS